MFPLKKQSITLNTTEHGFLSDYSDSTEIPILPHPGAFSKTRKHHNHEGIDLYCEDGDSVYSMEDGKILKIDVFTGEHAGTPWWNNTWSVLIEHKGFVLNYGEIIPNASLSVGDKVKEGDIIGSVRTVLMKDKGRPRSMLHLEMYTLGTVEPLKSWDLGQEKPANLLDPTQLLLMNMPK